MLTQLAADFFARSPVLTWPIVALGIFFAVFVAVGIRTLRSSDAAMQRLAELPLNSHETTEVSDP